MALVLSVLLFESKAVFQEVIALLQIYISKVSVTGDLGVISLVLVK